MPLVYETRELLKDFIEVTVTASKKKSKATKCSNHCTISPITHTTKSAARRLGRRTERKNEDVLAEHQSGFRRRKGTGDATGMLRMSRQNFGHRRGNACMLQRLAEGI